MNLNNDIPALGRFQEPKITRVFPNLIANEVVSFQPIGRPSSLSFFLRYGFNDKPTLNIGVVLEVPD